MGLTITLCFVNQLQTATTIAMNIGFYRYSGWAILEASLDTETDRIRKKNEKLFKNHNLRITTELGLIQTDSLDVPWIYIQPGYIFNLDIYNSLDIYST